MYTNTGKWISWLRFLLIKKNLHAEKSKFKLNNYKNLAQSDLENS